MEMAFWCEVAWLKLGEADLDGRATIACKSACRKPRTTKASGSGCSYASDAICLHEGPFHAELEVQARRIGPRRRGRSGGESTCSSLPEAKPSERASVKLGGVWEICARRRATSRRSRRADQANCRKKPVWRAIPVPGDKNKVREDLIFAHRLWYRTRIAVPASMAGRAFYVDFPYNNLNTTVYVNGVYCGFEKNPVRAVPGGRDQGHQGRAGERDLGRHPRRVVWPLRRPEAAAEAAQDVQLSRSSLFSQGFQDLDYPVWNCPQSGILATPTFVAAGGGVYAADVFVKPSVARSGSKRRSRCATPRRETPPAKSAGKRWTSRPARSNTRFTAASRSSVAAGKTQTVDALRRVGEPEALVARHAEPVSSAHDRRRQRQAGRRARKRSLASANGAAKERSSRSTAWSGTCGPTWSASIVRPEDWLAAYKRTNQRTTRLSTAGQAGHESRWLGTGAAGRARVLRPQRRRRPPQHHARRRNHRQQLQREATPRRAEQQGGSELKLALMKNWRDQCVAQVKGERNHPSIQIWSIENEFAYINLINLLGNSPNMDRYEEEITKTHDAVMAADPTRSAMIDGGGAMKENTLGVARRPLRRHARRALPRPGLRAVRRGRRARALEVGPAAAALHRRGFLRHRHQPGRLRDVGRRGGLPGQGRHARRHGPVLPHAQRRLPLGRPLCRVALVAGRRGRPGPVGRQRSARRLGAPVGLDLRRRADRSSAPSASSTTRNIRSRSPSRAG